MYLTPVRQPELTVAMRVVLVDWLVEVHRRFELLPETLYTTIHILDLYLSRVNVSRSKLQVCSFELIFFKYYC